MSFLYPAFLLGALAVAVPIVLHLLRRRQAPDVPFTAVRLLRRAPSDEQRRRRLRDPLLLGARIAALGLLGIVFARPFVTTPGADEPLRIVAIDRSYSMGAEGQFARALDVAREIVAASPRAARIAVVAFDDRADALAEPGPAAAATAVIDGLEPGYGGTQYRGLLARAIDMAASGPTHLDIVTDMQRAGWEGSELPVLPAHLRIRLHSVGLPPSNAAVTAVRRVHDGVLASVEQAGDAPLVTTARLVLDGRPVAEQPVTVAPWESVDVHFRDELPERGGIAVEIDDPGGFPADNVRHLVLDAAPSAGVLVVAEGAGDAGFYVTRVLEASGDPLSVREAAPARLGRMSADEWQDIDAVALLSTRGLDRRGRDALVGFVERGGGLLVAAGSDLDAAVLGSVMGSTDIAIVDAQQAPVTLAVTDVRHPIFQPFGSLVANIGDVRFDRAWDVRAAGWEVAARFSSGVPALLERRQASGRVVLFASDLDRRWNDFPLHATFVPFVIETIRHVAGRTLQPGAYVVADAPAGVGPRPGVYTTADGRRVAVDVDLHERSLAAMADDEFMAMVQVDRAQPAPVTRLAHEEVEARQSLWRYAILVMLAVLLIESFVGRPR
jgi:hypothetical protein